MIRTTLTLLAAATLSACSLIPTYERPAAPVPAVFPEAGTALATTPAAAALPWREFLADARLRTLVDTALAGNRDLRVALLQVEQARALLGVQRADQWPTVNVGANGSRSSSGDGINSVYSAGLAVSAYELDLFGRVRSLSEAAAARLLASDEGRRAAQTALIASVAQADLALRADDALIELTTRTLAAREQALALVRTKFDAGASAEPELRSAESLRAAAQASLAALQRQRLQDRNALALLIGQPVPDALPAAASIDTLELAALPAGLPAEVLLQRPDIRQAEQQLIAANAQIGAARAAFFPRITLTGSVGTASTELSGLFSNGAWSFAPQLVLPILDAGRNQANLDGARVGREIAVTQYERAIQVAFREVSDALAARATLGEQLAAQRAQADAEARRLQLAELLFQGGAASQLERLDAERSLLAARQAVVQLQLARLQNAVQLYRVLGGGPTP